MAALPAGRQPGALFQNIQNGGRQSLTGGAQTLTSKPALRAALAARVRPWLPAQPPPLLPHESEKRRSIFRSMLGF